MQRRYLFLQENRKMTLNNFEWLSIEKSWNKSGVHG